jgi:hypothetical protein
MAVNKNEFPPTILSNLTVLYVKIYRLPLNIPKIYSWFQTFALFWMLSAFFWVIPRRLNSTPTRLWRWNRQSVPKRRHIKFRRRGITQKKACNIPKLVTRGSVSCFSCPVTLYTSCERNPPPRKKNQCYKPWPEGEVHLHFVPRVIWMCQTKSVYTKRTL